MLYMQRSDHQFHSWEERTDWRYEMGFDGPEWRQHLDDSVNAITARSHLSGICAWAVPNEAAITAIAELQMPVVEIGAGTGYWAWLLSRAGVEIVAFDCDPTDENAWCNGDHWYPVQQGDETVLEGFRTHALLLCWPPYDTSMADDCLAAYPGDTLIYVGESCGGCNATELFFETLERDWIEMLCVGIPQWFGMHDWLWIYKRRP